MEESRAKAEFITNYLSPLLRAAGIRVEKAEYIKDEKTGEETVIVQNETINPTATSNGCIV